MEFEISVIDIKKLQICPVQYNTILVQSAY